MGATGFRARHQRGSCVTSSRHPSAPAITLQTRYLQRRVRCAQPTAGSATKPGSGTKTHLERNAAMCLRVSTRCPTVREPVPMVPPMPAAGWLPEAASECRWRLAVGAGAVYASRAAVPRSMPSHCSLRAFACVYPRGWLQLACICICIHTMQPLYGQMRLVLHPYTIITLVRTSGHRRSHSGRDAGTQEGGHALAETVVRRRGRCEIRAQIEP